jgi:tRNA(Ile)-lysidine synthase
MPNLVKKVQNTSFQYDLFKKGSRIILAVSGGPDSVCLLDIFSRLQKKYGLDLIVAHVNYGLRGKDSDLDEAFVKRLCHKYDLKLEISRPKIKEKSNLENRLRDIRYAFFEIIRKKYDFDSVAVAHNLDDQVETYLMRIIRGAGLQGLSAMKYKSGSIIRPLLDILRLEIVDYLKNNKLDFRTDRTNLENDFIRNKIRNHLIPIIEEGFNPKIKVTIFNSVLSISEDIDLLEKLAQKAYRANPNLSASKILRLDPAIQKRVLLLAILEKKSDLKNISSAHIREILKVIKSTKSKSQTVSFQGLKVSRKGDRVTIENIN